MTSDGEWIEVEVDPDWVFVNPVENEENIEDAREGPDYHDATTAAVAANLQDRLSDDALVHGSFEGTCKEEKDEGAHLVSDFESPHGFSEAGPCEDDDKSAHGFFHGSRFFEGACEDDEDAHGISDAETAHGFSEDSYNEEDEEEEEEDNDDYIDALHEGALQDKVNKYANPLTDAVERYYTNPVRESWQEYVCSVQTETRRELHKKKMASFQGYGQGYGPKLKAIKGSNCFNPLFEEMWLPWAMKAEYCHNEDMGLLICDGDTGWTQRTLAAKRYMSSAVPILPVLEYMVERAPGKKIAHIGSCSSLYWAALLKGLGAANVMVTEGACPVTCAPAGYPHIQQIGEEMFFMLDMAVGQALFFLRPSKRSRDAEPCMAERCLFCFSGDTIFFVGENGEHTDNFDMAQWVVEHELEGWRVEKEMEIPCWPGSHDVFLCITKASFPIANIA